MIEHIPLYPLAPLLFLAAVVLFALLMARHLRVFAYARPAAVGDEPGRLQSLFKYAIVQVRMFRDLDAGLLHAAIFWGFVILTVGTADRVTFGLIQTIVRPLLDGWLWRLLILGQNIFILTVLVAVAYALFRRLVWKYPRRTTLSRDGIIILLLIGARRPDRVVRRGFPARRVRRSRRELGDRGATRWASSSGNLLPASWLPIGYAALLLGERRARSASSSSTCRARSTSTSSRRSSTRRCAR